MFYPYGPYLTYKLCLLYQVLILTNLFVDSYSRLVSEKVSLMVMIAISHVRRSLFLFGQRLGLFKVLYLHFVMHFIIKLFLKDKIWTSALNLSLLNKPKSAEFAFWIEYFEILLYFKNLSTNLYWFGSRSTAPSVMQPNNLWPSCDINLSNISSYLAITNLGYFHKHMPASKGYSNLGDNHVD